MNRNCGKRGSEESCHSLTEPLLIFSWRNDSRENTSNQCHGCKLFPNCFELLVPCIRPIKAQVISSAPI